MKNILIVGSLAVLIALAATHLDFIGEKIQNLSAVFFADSITVSDLQKTYAGAGYGRKLNILVVPGHEPNFGGAEYKNLKERDMTVDLGNDLANYLRTNPRYNVIVSRTKNAWNPVLQNYFDQNWDQIKQFRQNQKTVMNQLMADGQVSKATDGMIHNVAPDDVALRMYGINKWIDENHIDIAINIHFNDNPRSNTKMAGDYRGFSIYVPDSQYSNAKASLPISQKVFSRLASFAPVSNLPKENAGILPDQTLIALGAGNTNDAASILVEYGYIYENWFGSDSVRQSVLNRMAYNTYLGIQDFFGSYDNTPLALR